MRGLMLSVIVVCLVFVFAIAPINILIAQKPPMMMDDYKGPIVTISGKVFGGLDYEKIEEGSIVILAKIVSEGESIREALTVAGTRISEPGEYSIVLPKDFGNIHIVAIQLKGETPQMLRGTYQANPIKIGSSDIQGVDITLRKVSQERSSSNSVPERQIKGD